MKISIGNDHAGTEYKFKIIEFLNSKNIEVKNHGTDSSDSVDYPDFVHPVAKDVENKKVDFGILLCGSANGVAMTANKYQGIRAGLCWKNEIVELIRNDGLVEFYIANYMEYDKHTGDKIKTKYILNIINIKDLNEYNISLNYLQNLFDIFLVSFLSVSTTSF